MSGVNCTRRIDTPSVAAQRPREQRLGDAGHALQQHVPPAAERHQHQPDRLLLTHHDRAELLAHLLHELHRKPAGGARLRSPVVRLRLAGLVSAHFPSRRSRALVTPCSSWVRLSSTASASA